MSDAIHPLRITVVGDLILDRYLIGDATKLNPEMPGVVIRIDKEEDRLGGAAAVAMIAAGLGARVTLAGVVGNDQAGARLRQLVGEHGVESHIWVADRPTTWKQRIVARGQLRPDRCDREMTHDIDAESEKFLSEVALGNVLLISDYGKGVLTRNLLDLIVRRARSASVPVLIDPARSRDWSEYGQVSLIKANLAEATESWGEQCSPLAMACRLSRRHDCSVVVTLGENGLVWAERRGSTRHFAAEPVAVRDVCGAGDTIFASLGVSIAHGWSPELACLSAVRAAACQVSRLGVAAVENAA